MYFKRIDIHGFKSFVEHTSITFGDGITAIVGPNGCGKSNISDAIRWVLGEQRPKLLRGAKMEDFIFNGSSTRKPGGMAEVSITIADVAGVVSRPELAEFDEITVTRRLYRSGESEYLINKTACRLKDIVDIFLDTGISTRAFSIIEQDQIQKIVTSKPEERRFIIEEAAGIMKYKNRRHAAVNKLEGSRLNLERINDIVSELERQRNSLKRQASKAERYKKFQTEIVELILSTSADEWKTLNSAGEELSRELERLEEMRTSLKADISTQQNRMLSLQNSIGELSDKMAVQKEEDYRLESLIEKNEGKIELFADQKKESGLQVEKMRQEIVNLDGRLEEIKLAIDEKNGNAKILETSVSEKSKELDRQKDHVTKTQSEINVLIEEISASERQLAEIVTSSSNIETNLASHEARVEMLERRKEKISIEKQEAKSDIENLKAEKKEKNTAIQSIQNRCGDLNSERERLDENLRSLRHSKSEKEESLSKAKTDLAQKTARLESLKELESSNEGYQDGIRSLMEMKKQGNEAANRLRGTLLEKIKVDPEFESAIELLLGERLQALLVDEPKDAVEAIELLRSRKLGRATFLLRNAISSEAMRERMEIQEGVIGFGADMVDADDKTKPVISRLLNDVVVVTDLNAGVRLMEKEGAGFTCITPQGDLIDRFGVISGGYSEKGSGGILERKRTIEELSSSTEKERGELEHMEGELRAIADKLRESETVFAEKDRLIKEEELKLVHEKKDMETLGQELSRHESRLETFRTEIDALEMERDSLLSEKSEMDKEFEDLASRKVGKEDELSSINKKLISARDRHASLSEEAQAAEVELATIKGELAMAEAEKERLGNNITELAERLAAIKEEIENNIVKQKEMEEEISRLKDEVHLSLEKRHGISTQLRQVSELLEGSRGELGNGEDELQKSNSALEEAVESINNAKIKASETSLRISNLLERAGEYDISQEKIESLKTDELDMDACRERLSHIKEKLAKMGDVNLTAIEDYNQVMERLGFLTTQRDDLVESIDDIRKTIEKINRTTRKLFEETFQKIRANFQQMFKKLFNGGEADMFLTDESNLLESGLEIYVRPPGKRKQNINLLSAGEKAMTAVSVLFSVFMVKPSPFCLLDEVDAPLDDTNVGRFKSILEEFRKDTQFLVITHNQKTMAFADRLYGVTMQEPGVSTILSVDLVDTDKRGREHLKVVHG